MPTEITQTAVRELLRYDADTGHFTWRERGAAWFRSSHAQAAWNARYAGAQAGARDSGGYIQIAICGQVYAAHRLVWLYVAGEWPGRQVDHINQNRSDNRISNLRAVTNQDNQRNSSLSKNNTSGVAGISWNKSVRLWHARITDSYRRKHLGFFVDWFEAVCARKSAESQLGFHPNHGRRAQ